MTRPWTAAVCLAMALCVSLGTVGHGDDDEPAAAPSSPLPFELETDPSDLPPGESNANTDTSPAGDSPDTPKAEDDPEPEEETVSEDEFLSDPFPFLESDMQSAAVDLQDGRTNPPAVVTQPRILSRLDLLIVELEKSCMGAGPGGGNRPANASTLKPGPGGQGEMRAPREDGRDWADLTPKEREKILQSRTDGFPPGFDAVLADYFRRVARSQEAAAPVEDSATKNPEGQD